MKEKKRQRLLAAAQRAVDQVPLYNPTAPEFVDDANSLLHRLRMEEWERDRAEYFRERGRALTP